VDSEKYSTLRNALEAKIALVLIEGFHSVLMIQLTTVSVSILRILRLKSNLGPEQSP
jgi:hypothetical protein